MTVERIKLKVTEVAPEPKKVGQNNALKLEFKATTPDNKTLPYFTFTQKFFPLIVKDKEIDADVDTTQREYPKDSGTFYTDRKVTQLYENGQPVGGQGNQRGNYGGRYSNPEERASIEAQVAAKIAAELIIAGKAPADGKLDRALGNWLMARLNPQTQRAE